VMVSFVTIENGEDMGLVAADKFGILFMRPAADSFYQFGIVAHWAVVVKSTLQLVGATFLKASQRLNCNGGHLIYSESLESIRLMTRSIN